MVSADEHGDDAGGHEVGHGPGQHGAKSEASEVIAAVRDQGSDASDLDADRAEVREAAQGEGGDGEAAGGENGVAGLRGWCTATSSLRTVLGA